MDLEDARTKADELGEMAKSSERRAKDLEAQNAGKDFLSAISVRVLGSQIDRAPRLTVFRKGWPTFPAF